MSKLFAGLKISQKGSDILALSINQSRQIEDFNSPIIKRSGNNESHSGQHQSKFLFDSPHVIAKDINLNFVSPIKIEQERGEHFCQRCFKWETWAKFYQQTFLSLESTLIKRQNQLNQAFQTLTTQLHRKQKQLANKEIDIKSFYKACKDQQKKNQENLINKIRVIEQLENQLIKKNTVMNSLMNTQSSLNLVKNSNAQHTRKVLKEIINVQNNKENQGVHMQKRLKTFGENRSNLKQTRNQQQEKNNTFYASDLRYQKDLSIVQPNNKDQWQQLVRKLRFENKNLKAYNLNLQQMVNMRNKKKFYF